MKTTNALARHAILAFALVLGAAPLSIAAAPASRATVVFLEGDVRIDGAAAEIGQALASVTLVETGPGATCEIVFDRKNAVRVSQNAVATLDFSGIVKEVTLKKGGLTSVLRKLGKAAGKDSFRVVTATAVAGVRGTSFCAWADADSTYVCACNGTVRTIDALGSNVQVLSAAHHTAREYTRNGEAIDLAQAGVEHHDDASVESLAATIGERLNWKKVDNQSR
jgi:hypothetical protein